MNYIKILSRNESKLIVGGYMPSDSICAVGCADGTSKSKDCGVGTVCKADSQRHSVYCGSTEYCVCDES